MKEKMQKFYFYEYELNIIKQDVNKKQRLNMQIKVKTNKLNEKSILIYLNGENENELFKLRDEIQKRIQGEDIGNEFNEHQKDIIFMDGFQF